jgi:hypothetical protein
VTGDLMEITTVEQVVEAAAALWKAMAMCPVRLKAVVGPDRASLQVPLSSGTTFRRQQTLALIGEVLGAEAQLVTDGITEAIEFDGVFANAPVSAFTFFDAPAEVLL